MAAWNTRDEATRRRLLEQSWSTTGSYADPVVHFDGLDAMDRHAAGFSQRWPGARIVVTGTPLTHHDVVCFGWRVLGPAGEVLREGVDFGELAPDRRFRRVIGFFGESPEQLTGGDR